MGKDSRKNIFSIQREQILDLYKAEPDAVVSLISHFQYHLNNPGQKVEEQQRLIEQQERRIHELEAIIKKDSHNSSKPPSSDGYGKSPVKQEKKKSGRRPGGQKGHEGNTMLLRLLRMHLQVVLYYRIW